MNDPLADVAELIRREAGITIKGDQLPSLQAALGRIEPGMSATAFLAARASAPRGAQLLLRLIDEVTVKETFFLRQPQELASIDWSELLACARAAGRDRVRAWVAACATGEEAYTLAMLASEALAAREPPLSILATDISQAALASARQGRYGRQRLRAVNPAWLERYFTRDGEHFAVGPELRDMVDFARHNLARDEIPPPGHAPFDLILCRNVLIYFDGAAIDRVIGALEGALSRDGMLLLGAADRLSGTSRRLVRLDRAPPPRLRATPPRALRRPLRHERRDTPPPKPPARTTRAALEDAVHAADHGQLELAIGATEDVLAENPLNADAYFIRGLAELGLGDPEAAAESLRRALYVDPAFGLAAFQLGRAHEARDDRAAATRAYSHALRALELEDDDRHAALLAQVDVGDMATVCELRLRALASTPR